MKIIKIVFATRAVPNLAGRARHNAPPNRLVAPVEYRSYHVR
jgi:hypothetical protein